MAQASEARPSTEALTESALPPTSTQLPPESCAQATSSVPSGTPTLEATTVNPMPPPTPPPRPLQPQPGVWSEAGVEYLKKRATRGLAGQPVAEDEVLLSENYQCVRDKYRLRRDGNQRSMTPLEEQTLFMWASRQIHVNEPPAFTTETHTGAERDVLLKYQHNNLGFRLYAILPTGFALPTVGTKWHFFRVLLVASPDGASKKRAKDLIASAQRIKCSARSQIAEFVFMRPDERDRWSDQSFNIGRRRFTLRATDTLAVQEATEGYDETAQSVLYQVHVLNGSNLNPERIRASIEAASDAAIIKITSPGDTELGPHRWEVTFDATECPQRLESMRGTFSAPPPRVLTPSLLRVPKHAAPEEELPGQGPSAHAAKYITYVDLGSKSDSPTIFAVSSRHEFRRQMKSIRGMVAPALAAKLRAEKEARRAAETQIKAKKLAEAAAAAAKTRNAAAKQKRDAAARAKRLEKDARRALHDRLNSELRGERRTPKTPRATPSTNTPYPNDGATTQQEPPTPSPTPKSAELMEKTVPPFQPSQCSEGNGMITHNGDLRDTPKPSSSRAESEIDDVDMNAASDGGQVLFSPAPTSMGDEMQTNATVDIPTNADDDSPTSGEVDNTTTSSDVRNSSANDDAQRATSLHDTSPTPTVDEVDVEDIRMEPAVYLGDTLHINEFEHYVTQTGEVDSCKRDAAHDSPPNTTCTLVRLEEAFPTWREGDLST